ncbi:MAG: ABC transporter substrate-binding protein [Candidatus Rokuibacteriota bacterium]
MLAVILLLQSLLVAVSGPPASPEYLPLRVAQAEGHFRREGLEVTLRTTRAEPGAAEALAQGQADLAATTLDAILRFGPRIPGQSSRLVFGLTAAPPVALLVPTSQQAIVKSLQDLPGTRVGLASPGAPEHAWFGWLLARAGLSPAQVWVVSLGSRGLVSATESGEVHAALVHEPYASRLVAEGRAKVLADLRSPDRVAQTLGGPTVNAAVFGRSDRMPADRHLTAFARALDAAERRIAETGAAELATALPRPVVGSEFETRLEATRALYLKDGLVTADQVQETIALIRAHLPLPGTLRIPRPEEMLHVEPARRAATPPARK